MITIVVGGQYGGEGKGKVAAYLAKHKKFSVVCRTGGINSKHTVIENGKTYDLRQVPTATAVGFGGKIVYGAGSLIHIKTLKEEMALLGISTSRVLIDHQTGILTDEHVEKQRSDSRYQEIGSTLTGTGYATAQRALRKLPLAKDFPELQPLLGDVPSFLYNTLSSEEELLIEGHQSSGLSNFHGDYPYVSNRDSTASEILSELGVGPRYPLRIVLVLKIFPTRNHNGHLPNEMSEKEIESLGIKEYGGGSWGIPNNKRRVGRIDLEEIKRSVYLNTPTEIALTGIDYFDPNSKASTDFSKLSENAKQLVAQIEKVASVPVSIISTGPETDATIIRA